MTKGGNQLSAVTRRLDATPAWLGLGLGGLLGLALAWGALGFGPWAAGLLALGLAGLALGLGARLRWRRMVCRRGARRLHRRSFRHCPRCRTAHRPVRQSRQRSRARPWCRRQTRGP